MCWQCGEQNLALMGVFPVRKPILQCLVLIVALTTCGCFGGKRQSRQQSKPVITKPKSGPQTASQQLPTSSVSASEFAFEAPKSSKGFDDVAGHAALAPKKDLTRVPPDAGKLIKDPTLPPPRPTAETSPDYLADALGIKVSAPPQKKSGALPAATVAKVPGLISSEPLESVSFSNSRPASFSSRPRVTSRKFAAPAPQPTSAYGNNMGFMPPVATTPPTWEKPKAVYQSKAPVNSLGEPLAAPTGSRRSYVMQRGDTLSSVARANGTSLGELLRANGHIDNPDIINAGDTIFLP